MPKYLDLGYDGCLSIAEIMETAKKEDHKEKQGKDGTEKDKGGD